MNFGGYRKTQLLSGLILRFSALEFCSSERRAKKTKKMQIKRRNHSVVDGHGSWQLKHPGFWGCYMLHKVNLRAVY
jgi:hypothetical protein